MYEYAIKQIKSQGVLHPGAYMFAQRYFYEEEPKAVIEIITQLSLKSGLKEWGDKAH